MEDEAIIDLYFARDERALRETEAKYGPLCRQVAGNILGTPQDTEECLNDVYLALWGAIPPARPRSLKAFASGVTRRQALKRLRHDTAGKRSAGCLVPLSELAEVLPDESFRPDVEDGELARLIGNFLKKQTPEARCVFIRRYWYFDSVRDIAGRYGFSENKVKSLLFRGRNRLRDYLRKEGITL